jgi:hypothetical protein
MSSSPNHGGQNDKHPLLSDQKQDGGRFEENVPIFTTGKSFQQQFSAT